MTQSLTTTGDRSVLRMERVLPHPPEKVWRALTESEHLGSWFPTTVTLDLRMGGAIGFGFGPDGTITDLDPPALFAFTWGDDHLRWEIHPDGAGSRLLLVHTFDDHAGAASFAAGWNQCIAGLALTLDGRPGADPGIDHVAMHERYVTELGLAGGAAESTPEGWRVRFERQLTRPAEVVWPVLADAPPWADAGRVVVREELAVLEHTVPDGRVRWELGEGTGHGARLVLTWTGEGDPDRALAEGERGVAALLARLG
jgi:uncharacterized protein YndB with AHSA1/START domain